MSQPNPVETLKKTHGGKRAGAGMPKGTVTARTLDKEQAKAILRERVLARLGPIVDAGIDSATGIKHFMLRNPDDGTFRRLTDPTEIDSALAHPDAKEGSSFWIYVKDPQTPAMADLLNRAIGKPTEEMKVELSGEVQVIERLKKARERALGR